MNRQVFFVFTVVALAICTVRCANGKSADADYATSDPEVPMAVTLTDDPSAFPDILAPSGGDARNASSVLVPLQRLANRTRQNKNRVDAIAPADDGVRVLRTVASIAALRAIGAVDHTDQSYCVVEDVGFYRYDINNLEAEAPPLIVQPTDVVGGGTPGRWLLGSFGRGTLNVPYGVPQCDAAGRVPASCVRNGIVAVGHVEIISLVNVTTAIYADLAGSAIVLAGLAAQDIVLWNYAGEVALHEGSRLSTQGVVVLPDASTVVPANMEIVAMNNLLANNSTGQALNPSNGTYVCTQAGTHTFKIQAKAVGLAGAPTSSETLLNLNSRVLVIRP